jgi:hypothetical protein
MTSTDSLARAAALTERDLALLDLFLQHRFLTRRHIQGLYFNEHRDPRTGAPTTTRTPRAAQRRLQQLRQSGLLVRRYLAQPDGRRNPEPYYCLTPDGARLACARAELPHAERRKRSADALANPLFVRHALAAADLHCALVTAARSHPMHKCQPQWWRGEHVTAHQFADHGTKALLRPDGYTRYRAERDVHHLLAEVDLGTMPLPRLQAKLELYRGYARSGAWQSRYPVFPKLLLLTTEQRRITRLHHELHAPFDYVLLSSTHDHLRAHGPLAPIWQQPGRDDPRPLLDPAQ